MNSFSHDCNTQQISKQLHFVSSMLSLPDSFQEHFSQGIQEPRKIAKNDYPSQECELNFDELHLNIKNLETVVCQQRKQPQKLLRQNSKPLVRGLQILENEGKDQRKEQIKTFPNFIFRTFSKYLADYEHFYSQKGRLGKLKKYLKSHQGAKHYTLQELQCLFKDSSLWNSQLNRRVLHRMLQNHSYKDIFCSSQRKKKKPYLVMTKVFKLRCRNSHLSARVQADRF